MKYEDLKWGMIGVGDVTRQKSAPSFNKIDRSSLIAVGSRTPEKAHEFASRNRISKCYDDPFDVITDPNVDIVYVATPPDSHLEYGLRCIEEGKPVYLEKPMARNFAECRAINEAAEKRGRLSQGCRIGGFEG